MCARLAHTPNPHLPTCAHAYMHRTHARPRTQPTVAILGLESAINATFLHEIDIGGPHRLHSEHNVRVCRASKGRQQGKSRSCACACMHGGQGWLEWGVVPATWVAVSPPAHAPVHLGARECPVHTCMLACVRAWKCPLHVHTCQKGCTLVGPLPSPQTDTTPAPTHCQPPPTTSSHRQLCHVCAPSAKMVAQRAAASPPVE